MMRRLCLPGLLLLVSVACQEQTPGRFALTFSWDQPPEAPVFVWLEVRERPDPSEEGRLLAAAEPAAFEPGASLSIALDGVPHGDDRVVVVEVREAADENLRVLWYGFSEPFSLGPGDDHVVDVPLTFHAPEAEAALATEPVALRFAGEARQTISADEMARATVVITAAGAVSVVLANDASFSAGLRTVPLKDAEGVTCEVTQDQEVPDRTWTRCVIEAWDLSAGLSDLADGSYAVFAKLKDRHGYESTVFRDSVTLDTHGPVVLSASAAPTTLTVGAEAQITVTLQEALEEAPDVNTIRSEPAEGLILVGPERVPDTTTYTWRATATEEGDGQAFELFVSLSDELGNPAEERRLEHEDGAPLQVLVDAIPPALDDGHEIVFEAGGEPAGPDGLLFGLPGELGDPDHRVSFSFVIDEAGSPPALPSEGCDAGCPAVRLGDQLVGAVTRRPDLDGDGSWGFTYTYDVDPKDWGEIERDLSVSIAWQDRAENPLSVKLDTTIRLDFVRPGALECALLPEPPTVLNAAHSLVYVVTATEPLAEAPALVPGGGVEVLDGIAPTPSNGGRTWTWTRPAEGLNISELSLSATLVDEAGNASADSVCPVEVGVDALAPELRVTAIETLPVVSDDEGALLIAGPDDVVRVRFEVVEVSPHVEPPTVWLDTPAQLHFQTVMLREVGDGLRAYQADLVLDAGAQQGSEGSWRINLSALDAAGNEVRLEGALDGAEVRLDYTPPEAECFLNTDSASAGDELRLSVTLSEPIGTPAPALETDQALTLDLALSDPGGLPPRFLYRAPVALGDPELAWSYTLRAVDLVGNEAPEALCEGGGVTDGQAPRLAAVVTPSRDTFGLPRDEEPEASTLSFDLLVTEPHPPAIPAEARACGDEDACPRVALSGQALGTLERAPDLDIAGSHVWGFRYRYDVDVEDWGQVERDVSVSIRWADAPGNAMDLALPAPLRFDFVRPMASCALVPDPADGAVPIGQRLVLQVSPLETLEAGLDPQIVALFDPPFDDGPRDFFSLDPGTAWRFSGAVLDGDDEREVTLRVLLTDEAGNGTPEDGTACDAGPLHGAIDGARPTVSAVTLSADDEGWDGVRPLRALETLYVELLVHGADGAAAPEVRVGEGALTPADGWPKPSDDGAQAWRYQRPLAGDEGQGEQMVRVSGVDDVGNAYEHVGPSVTFDFADPVLECFLNNDQAKAGDEVRVTLTFSEPIAAGTFQFESGLPLLEDEDATDADAAQPRFVYAFEVPPGQDRESWTFQASGRDLAGNPGEAGVSCQGGGVVDGDAPEITVHELWSGYEDPTAEGGWRATPGLARDDATVRVRFSSDEAPAPGSLKVWIDDDVLPAEACEDDAETGGWVCTRIVDVDDPTWPHGPTAEPTLPVLIELEDDVGNRASSPVGNVRVDPNPPFLTGAAAFTRCDFDEHIPRAQPSLPVALENQGSCALDGRCEGYCYVSVVDADGQAVERPMALYVDLSTSEPVAAPRVYVEGGGDFVLDPTIFTTEDDESTFLRAYYRPDGSETQWDAWPEGHPQASDVRLTARDAAGNELDVSLGDLRFDFEAPGAPVDEESQAAYRYERVPWGSDQTGGAPRFSLSMSLAEILDEVGEGGRVEVYDGFDVDSAQLITWGYVGSDGLRPLGKPAEDEEARLDLGGTDRGLVYVQLVDAAANRSDDGGDADDGLQATLVRSVDWVATTGAAGAGNAQANPHRFETRAWFVDRFHQADAVAPAEAAALPGRATTITTDGAGAWRHHPVGALAPVARVGYAGAYDALRDRVLLHGGEDVAPAGALWSFDGAHWTSHTPTDPEGDGHPADRWHHGMVYDPRRDRVVLFGGVYDEGEGFDPILFDDTWEWDGVSWRQVPLDDPEGDGGPPGRERPLMVWDPVEEHVLMIEGPWDGNTWIYDGSSWRLAFEGPWRRSEFMAYVEFLPDGFPADQEAFLPISVPAWDPVTARVVVAGEPIEGGADGLFSWNGVGWDRVRGLPSLDTFILLHDRMNERLVLGGLKYTGMMETTSLSRRYAWVGEAWELIDEVVGESWPTGDPWPFNDWGLGMQPFAWFMRTPAALVVLTHELMDTSFGQWGDDGWRVQELTSCEGWTSPPARLLPDLVDAPGEGGVLLFGGQRWAWHGVDVNEEGLPLLDRTWRWDGADWRQRYDLSEDGGDPTLMPRDLAAVTRDPVTGGALVHGGRIVDPNGMFHLYMDDTWVFSDDSWAAMVPAVGSLYENPPKRLHARMAYDAVRARVVLFGGSPTLGTTVGGHTEQPADTWLWDGVGWARAEDLDPEGDGGPSGRYGHAMVYDPRTERVLLYGGAVYDPSCEPPTDPFATWSCYAEPVEDLWAWDGVSWERLASGGDHPGPQVRHALVWDAQRQRVVLRGGDDQWNQHGLAPESMDRFDQALYEWDGQSWSRVPVADPEGVGAPLPPATRLSYDTRGDELVMPSVFEGGGTWIFDRGKRSFPAQIFRVDAQRMDETNVYTVREISTRWGTRATHQDTAVPPIESPLAIDLRAFSDNAFVTQAVVAGDAQLAGDVLWSTSDPRLLGQLLQNHDGDLVLAVTPAVPNGTGRSRLETDYVEATIRYELQPPSPGGSL